MINLPRVMNELTPRSRRYRISAIFFFYGLCYASWASRIPTIQQNLHLSEAGLGAVLLAMPVGSFITVPFTGYLVGKSGSRKVVIFSVLAYTSMLVFIGFAHTVLQLVIALFFFGSFGNMLNISINTQAIGVEALYQKRILSSFHGVWSLAGLAGASIGTFVIGKSIGTDWHLLAIGIAAFGTALICIPYLLHTDMNQDKKRKAFVMPDKSMMVLGMIAFCSMMCQGAMFDWTGVYFKKVLLADKKWIGVGLNAFMVSMALVRFISDWLTQHTGLRRILQYSGILSAGGLLISVFFPYVVPATLGFIMVGIGVSPVVPLVFSAVGRTKTMSPGVAIAAVSTLGFIGLLIGPPMIGFIAGATSLRISFVILAAIAAMVFVLSFKIKEE